MTDKLAAIFSTISEPGKKVPKQLTKHFGTQHDQQTHGRRKVAVGGKYPTVDNEKDTEGKYSAEARQLAASVRASRMEHEPQLTDSLMRSLERHGANTYGLKFRVKTEKSIARKIDADSAEKGQSRAEVAEGMNDIIRYTGVVEEGKYSDTIWKVLDDLRADGIEFDRIKNFWPKGDPYDGINIKMKHPAGFKFELQFHTPESIETKNKSHKIYDLYREETNTKKRYTYYNRMVRLWAQVNTPSGALEIGEQINESFVAVAKVAYRTIKRLDDNDNVVAEYRFSDANKTIVEQRKTSDGWVDAHGEVVWYLISGTWGYEPSSESVKKDNPTVNSVHVASVMGSKKRRKKKRGISGVQDMSKKEPIKDPKGGLTAAGRAHFKRKEGANLKPGVKGKADTPEKMRRKGSFLTRFYTNPSGPLQNDKGEPTRLALAAAAWGEPVPKNRSDAAKLAAKGRRLLERYENVKKKDSRYKGNTTERGYGWEHQQKREKLLANGAKCHWCGAKATQADHVGKNRLVASCASCNNKRSHKQRKKGGLLTKHASHDQKTHGRRKTATGGGTKPKMRRITEAASKRAKQLAAMARDGGFTFNPKRSEMRSKGVAVAVGKENERKVRADEFSEESIRQYARDHAELLAQPRHHLGAWRETEKGVDYIYLDVSVVMPSLESAADLGRANDQIGIFDLSTFTTYYRAPDKEGDLKYIPLNLTDATGYAETAATDMATNVGKADGDKGVMFVPGEMLDESSLPKIVERIMALKPVGKSEKESRKNS